MAIKVNILNSDSKTVEMLCSSLQSSPAFITNEILVSDNDAPDGEKIVTVVIGNDNACDTFFTIDGDHVIHQVDAEEFMTYLNDEPIGR